MAIKARQAQQGVVIITALFMVALIAAMATLIMSRLGQDTRRTTLILRSVQADDLSRGAVAWAKAQLIKNVEQARKDQVIDKMPLTLKAEQAGAFTITITIFDLQARFNLNSVTSDANQDKFVRLMRAVQPTLPKNEAKAIAAALQQWITPSATLSAQDKKYFELKPPYRMAHQPMQSISELRAVLGVSATLYQALEPYIIALPAKTLLNIQTAPAPVLMTLQDHFNREAAQELIKIRTATPFTDLAQLKQNAFIQNHQLQLENMVTLVSDYFMVETVLSNDEQHLVYYTVLARTQRDKTATVQIVWQSRGTW